MSELDLDAMVKELLPEIEESFDKHGWDQPTAMLFITRNRLDPTHSFVEAFEMIGWDVVSAFGHPMQQTLEAFTTALKAMPADMRRGVYPDAKSIYGLLFVSETWALVHDIPSGSKQAMAKAAEMKAAARAHRINEHPDRIEARLLTVVTRAGRTYSYIHHRISGHTELFDSQVTTSGAIPELMADLLTETIK